MILPDFDARNVPPSQGGSAHPAGMFDFSISNTYLKATKDNTGEMLVVELTSPAGSIEKRYNVINPSPQAVEIAHKELSALCHAVGIFHVAFPKNPDGSPVMQMAGHTLRGGRGRMEVAPQTDKEGKPNGYMEVKKVFDVHGNEPGKARTQQQPQPQNQQQPQGGSGWGNSGGQQQQPMQQQPSGSWGNPSPNNPPANTQQPVQEQPQQQGQPQGGWAQQQPQQGGNPQQPAPWSR